jgi:hypothetical protein
MSKWNLMLEILQVRGGVDLEGEDIEIDTAIGLGNSRARGSKGKCVFEHWTNGYTRRLVV